MTRELIRKMIADGRLRINDPHLLDKLAGTGGNGDTEDTGDKGEPK